MDGMVMNVVCVCVFCLHIANEHGTFEVVLDHFV